MDNKTFGAWCEDKAAEYLQLKGWSVLDRNARFKVGEIDIVAEHNGQLYFVEVKGRRSLKFGSVVQSATTQKIMRLKRAVYLWKKQHNERRFGVLYFVGIFVNSQGVPSIEEYLIE